MYFDGPNQKRNFIIAVICGFAAISILIFGVIAFIANLVSPKPTPTGNNPQQTTEQRPQTSSGDDNTQDDIPTSDDDTTLPGDSSNIHATEFYINPDSVTIAIGESTTLVAVMTPADSTDKVTWSSSNEDIIKVNENGVVTGVKEGIAYIFAEASENIRASASITVKAKQSEQPTQPQTQPQQPKPTTPNAINVSSIQLNTTNVSLEVGDTYRLSATIQPSNATNQTITWSSSNANIVAVSGGVITGKNVGTATITARSHNGKTASATVTVLTKTPSVIEVTGVKISPSSASIKVGGTITFTASVLPSNATNKNITWSSSNTNIATVTGGKVTGKKVGTVTIKARSINGKEVSATLTVTPATTTISATGIKLNSSAITIKVGSSYCLTATVSPSNVTDNTVTWSSSNTNIATVTGGTVTSKKIGKATITAKTHNGIAATATVTVKSTIAIDSTKPIITTVAASK